VNIFKARHVCVDTSRSPDKSKVPWALADLFLVSTTPYGPQISILDLKFDNEGRGAYHPRLETARLARRLHACVDGSLDRAQVIQVCH